MLDDGASSIALMLDDIPPDFKKKFGNILHVDNLNNLSELCEELRVNNNISVDKVKLFYEKNLSNLGDSANFAADYLIRKSKFK